MKKFLLSIALCGTLAAQASEIPEAAPVRAYFTPAVESSVTYKTGNPMKVVFFIVAAATGVDGLHDMSGVVFFVSHGAEERLCHRHNQC